MPQTDNGVARTVAAGFTALLVAFGVAYGFGVFLPAIAAEFQSGAGQTAGLFSATAFVFFCLGALTGPLAERHGVRPLLIAAALLLALGLFGTSIAPNLLAAYLTYGVGTGLGVGCVLVPVVGHVGAIAPPPRRALAVGLVVTGIGLGTVFGAPLAQWLIGTLGWRTAQQLLAVVVLVTLLACSVLVVERPATSGRDRPRYPREHIRSARFGWLWASTVLASTVLYTPFAVLPTQAATLGISPAIAASLIGLIGLVSVVGRLVIARVRRPQTLLITHTAAVAAAAVATLLWAHASSVSGLAAFVVLFGLGYGAFIALLPLVLAALFATDRLSSLLGLQYVASGVGAVLGPTGTGLIAEHTGTWTPALWGLVAVGVAACLVLLVTVRLARPQLPASGHHNLQEVP
ncbi:MFS family permease [Prauserella isguenensis]|uniref:MFS family permease n=1 Tax=Prauserella isguenensis TaxID=1470180 RepID=A0A839S866_9PSEU|nr:MFS transporter [Prauserella isguenensis]MBB3053180.1 MFS family permease [Prauserella isguenensis]